MEQTDFQLNWFQMIITILCRGLAFCKAELQKNLLNSKHTTGMFIQLDNSIQMGIVSLIHMLIFRDIMVHLIMNVGFNTFNYNCTQLRGFIQIDKTRRGVFTKIFCFKGCRDPDSTVTDWRRYDHEKKMAAYW